MKFKPLSAEQHPKNGQRCVIKEKNGKKIDICNSLQFYYDDCGFMAHPRVVAYAPVPPHVALDRFQWKSIYWEDELPDHDCNCLICTEGSRNVKIAYFHKGDFLGFPDVFAFIEI